MHLKLRNTNTIFYRATAIIVKCIRDRFQQKDLIETLQTLESITEDDFGHELQQMSSFFSSDLHKFKLLLTHLKTLNYIVDEKQVGIKDAITVISPFSASQKSFVSDVLKFVKLIVTVPATNIVSERSCSTFPRFKTCLRSCVTQELPSYCLFLATYGEKVAILELVEIPTQFCFEKEHRFFI